MFQHIQVRNVYHLSKRCKTVSNIDVLENVISLLDNVLQEDDMTVIYLLRRTLQLINID